MGGGLEEGGDLHQMEAGSIISESSPIADDVPGRRKSLGDSPHRRSPEFVIPGRVEAEAAALLASNIRKDTGFQRPRLQMEDMGVNCTCCCLAMVYFLLLLAFLMDMLISESVEKFDLGTEESAYLFPLTNDTQLFDLHNENLSPQDAEMLAKTGYLVSANPRTVFPAEGGAFTYLYDEVDSADFIADVWLSNSFINTLRQVTFYLSFGAPEPWTYEALGEDIVVDVVSHTCWKGGDCDSATNADFKLVVDMSGEQAVRVSGHRENVVRSGDPSQIWWFATFQYSIASVNSAVPFQKTSEAAFRINSDGYFGNCNAANSELCTPTMYLKSEFVKYDQGFALFLLIVMFGFNIWWVWCMHRRNPFVSKWSREQRWLIVMAAGTVLLINPFCMAEHMLQAAFYYQLGYVSELIFVAGKVLLWAFFSFFADAPSRPIKSGWKFYAPKILFAASKFLTGVGLATCNFAELWSSRSPGSQSFSTMAQSWSTGRLRAYTSFSILDFSLSIFAFLWWFLILHRGREILRRLPYSLTRSLQLQFRFASSIMTSLVLLIAVNRCWWIILSWRDFLNVSNNELDYLSPLERFVMATQSAQSTPLSLATGTALVAFASCMQFFFMPARDQSNVGQRGWSRDNMSVKCVKTERERLSARTLQAAGSGLLSLVWHNVSEPATRILVFETALLLLQMADEAYRCFSQEELQSRLEKNHLERMVDCELHDCDLLATLHEPEDENIHDTHCLIVRHRATNRLVVSWRGTKSRKQVETDLRASKKAVHTGIFLTRPPGSWPRPDDALHPRFGGYKRKRNKFLPYADRLPDYLQRELLMSGRSLGSMMKEGRYAHVHAGFWGSYNRLRERVHAVILEELLRNPGELIITGHSLGGALATICAYDMAVWLTPAVNAQLPEDASKVPPVIVYSFGSPRVFSPHLSYKFDHAVPQCFRIICDGDVVPSVPVVWMGYSHCGVPVYIDKYGTGSVIVHPSKLESHIQLSGTTKLRVGPHLLLSYSRALEGCMNPVEDEATLRDVINEVYLRHSLASWGQKMNRFPRFTSTFSAADDSGSSMEEVDDRL